MTAVLMARNLTEVAGMTQPGVFNRNRCFRPWGQLQTRHERSALPGSRLVRLRIQVLPSCADCAEDPRAGLASLQLMSLLMRNHWFVPTWAGTCCPESVVENSWKFLRLFGRLSFEQSDVVMSTDIEQALMLAAAQQSVSIATNLLSHQTYTLASATGSGARCAWYHVESQTSLSNFYQHVHTWSIALALWNGAAL